MLVFSNKMDTFKFLCQEYFNLNVLLQATYYRWRDFTCWFSKASEILPIVFTQV